MNEIEVVYEGDFPALGELLQTREYVQDFCHELAKLGNTKDQIVDKVTDVVRKVFLEEVDETKPNGKTLKGWFTQTNLRDFVEQHLNLEE